MQRLFSVLLASVLAAAFLGPGTVTTAARAGASFGSTLLWTLVFATIACGVLQEASARLTVVSGHNLGEALRQRFGAPDGEARRGGAIVLGGVGLAIVGGCAAYEAGNLLGGVAGAALAVDLPGPVLTLLSAGGAALLLALGSTRLVINVLSALVALMGVAFLATAARLLPPLGELVSGLLIPRVPEGSGLLVLGLIGTTVVPYNIFLGSGLARELGEEDPARRAAVMRFGLAVAIGLGGLISMAVVVVGGAVEGDFTFAALGAALASRLGTWAEPLFALGLFAAGFTSAVTAPMAAAITARSLYSSGPDDPRWSERAWRYRAVWIVVLLIGAAFGLAEVRPIPAILAAQALNGLLLPGIAIFLLVAVNDRRLMGTAVNGALSNAVTASVVAVTVLLGVRGIGRAAASAVGAAAPEGLLMGLSGGLVLVLAWPVARWVRAGRLGG